jgi:enoyl-CoA hydratase/carnithine racemase
MPTGKVDGGKYRIEVAPASRRLCHLSLGKAGSEISPNVSQKYSSIEQINGIHVLRLRSDDDMNRLSTACILELTSTLETLAGQVRSLIITGNQNFFSAGADLHEIAALTALSGLEFSQLGQLLMNSIECFPAPVYAAISGYCMGGGLDMALACHRRVAAPNAIFGHRGAVLGLITGWGGTQRLPRLVGKARALQIFVAAEKITAGHALRIGLVETVAEDPVPYCLNELARRES